MIVGIIDMETTAESNEYRSQSSDAETPTDTRTQQNNISAFEESGNLENEEPIRSCLPEISTDEEYILLFQEVADYFRFEVQGTTFNTHFSEILKCKMSRICFSWIMI